MERGMFLVPQWSRPTYAVLFWRHSSAVKTTWRVVIGQEIGPTQPIFVSGKIGALIYNTFDDVDTKSYDAIQDIPTSLT